jgi:hypothetical protein
MDVDRTDRFELSRGDWTAISGMILSLAVR